MFGKFLQLIVAKGWHAPAILILKTVLTEDLIGYAISIFYVIANIIDSVAPAVFAWVKTSTIGSQTQNPSGFGMLLFDFIGIADLLSIFLFYLAGL